MQPEPYYSIVVASRNDGHGGNIMKRMRLFVQGLIDQANRHGLDMELVFVEWNPPADRPLLHTVLPQPKADDRLRLRYIQVPAALHARYKRAQEIPLFQMIAKNVGIRRARGRFILATNVDLLFSDPLMRRMAARDLQAGHFYRANRCDIPDGIDEGMPLDAQLAFAAQNIIRVNGWDSRYHHVDARAHGMKEMGPISRWITDRVGRRHRARQPVGEREYYLLDRMACGDFTLMHRDDWARIEGYAELDLYSIHVDTLCLVAARALGMRQVVFPTEACTYHIDHPAGWSSMGPVEKLKFLEQRPGIDFGILLEVTYDLLEHGKALGINGPDWGYNTTELEEISF